MSAQLEEILIDLSQVEQAKLEDTRHFFHQGIYHRLALQMESQLRRSQACIEKPIANDSISEARSHDAILLDGERGSGKTSILINFPNYIASAPSHAQLSNKVLFLEPVDPTLLNDNEDFLNIVVGQINRNSKVTNALENGRADRSDSYYKTLEDLANALESEQTVHNRVGLDRLLSYQGSLEITKLTHAYFREVLELTGTRLILLPIDDVDMSLCHGHKVLEVVRKYLCSPYVMPLVSGNLDLYNELIVNHFISQLVVTKREDSDRIAQDKKCKILANEYLRKVFPVHNRQTVPTVEGYLEGHTYDGTPVNATVINEHKRPLIDLKSLGNLMHAVINGRVNGEEQSAIKVSVPTARQLIQLLKTLEQILEKLSSGLGPLTFARKTDALTWWLLQSRATAFEFYTVLAKHFHDTQEVQLKELCSGMALLNGSSDPNKFGLNKVIYLNPLRQVERNDRSFRARNNETYSLYIEDGVEEFNDQLKRLPLAFQHKEIHTLTGLPAIEPADRTLMFRRAWKPATENAEFLSELMSHSDFYTSYQTAPLIFFGRFFELITTSLMQNVDISWLESLMTSPPYYSIFSASATKPFDVSHTDSEPLGQPPNSNWVGPDRRRLYLSKLVDDINLYRFENATFSGFFADLALLQALQSKYFNQINLFKKAGYQSINREGKRAQLVDDALLSEVSARAMFSFWSAIGSFEVSELYFSVAPRIAHQNFASVSRPIDISTLENNNAYRFNIKALTDIPRNSFPTRVPFTSVLRDHPIFVLMQEYINSDLSTSGRKRVMPGTRPQEAFDPNEPPLPAVDIVAPARRPKYYSELSRVLRPAIREQEYLAWLDPKPGDDIKKLHDVLALQLSQLHEKALIATSQDERTAAILLAKLGICMKRNEFFDRSKMLDRLLHLTCVALTSSRNPFANPKVLAMRLRNLGVNANVAKLLSAGI
jgi:hypothetical protein